MPEADDHFLVRHTRADVCLGLIGRVVALLNLEGDFIGAAMFRASQGADWADEAGVDILSRAGDYARGEGGSVELVLGVEDERGMHRAHPGGRRGFAM